MGCPRATHRVRMGYHCNYPWDSHGLPLEYTWDAHGISTGCDAHGMPLECTWANTKNSWATYGLAMGYSRGIHEISWDSHGMPMGHTWTTHGLLMGYSWVTHGKPCDAHGLPMGLSWVARGHPTSISWEASPLLTHGPGRPSVSSGSNWYSAGIQWVSIP